MIPLPTDLERVLNSAWEVTRQVPGFLGEEEARLLGTFAACVPANGSIVEIGSFKGRSTVMLAKVAAHYGLGPVVAIDPHTYNLSVKTPNYSAASTYEEFLCSLRDAGVFEQVEIHHAFSTEVSATWSRPVRLLWIDGDHSYRGAKQDFDGFYPHLRPYSVVALHDALNNFPGPIRVFVEDILRKREFGPAGFVHSIAWSQFRPDGGNLFTSENAALERHAARLIPQVQGGNELHGFAKLRYKLARSRVPRAAVHPREIVAMLEVNPRLIPQKI